MVPVGAFGGVVGAPLDVLEEDARAWWEWLWDVVSAVAEEATGEAAIVFDGLGEVGDGETPFVESERLGAVVGPRDGVVEDDGVCLCVAADGDAVEGVVFEFGAGSGAVFVAGEVSDGEELEPRSRVRLDA